MDMERMIKFILTLAVVVGIVVAIGYLVVNMMKKYESAAVGQEVTTQAVDAIKGLASGKLEF